MGKIKNALTRSWEEDRVSFIWELIGVAFTIAASLMLATTAKNPNMLAIFPMYEVGSIALMCVYYRKHMVWSVVLTAYFVVINLVGFFVALF